METAITKLNCLLLAAGSSSRMGQNKLNLPLPSGLSVLEQTVRELSAVDFADRIIVAKARSHLSFSPENYGFRLIEIGNEAALGMHRSLRAGIAAIAKNLPVLVALGDLPFVTASHYRAALEAYLENEKNGLDLLQPILDGKRGNPAILHHRYFREILAEPDRDQGARYLFERYPERTILWAASASTYFQDLDTPEDYQKCLN